jgi:O-methyltransferase
MSGKAMRAREFMTYVVRELAYHTPLSRYLFPSYQYMFTPAQLGFLCDCIDRTAPVSGSLLEIGCHQGRTTLFLNAHMDEIGLNKPYFCIDTFKGFTQSDISGEGASIDSDTRRTLRGAFRSNRVKWFRKTMLDNGVARVRAIQGDIKRLSLSRLDPVSMCLVDVDLYAPVRAALEKVWPILQPGGVIVVDDCSEDPLWEGAYRAYREFAGEHDLEPEVVHGKLGVLRK